MFRFNIGKRKNMIDMEQVKQSHLYGTMGGCYTSDTTTPNSVAMVVIERDIEKINSVEIEEVTTTDNDIKEIEYAGKSIKW